MSAGAIGGGQAALRLLLPCGRRHIAWRAYGVGYPVFFAHGNLNSRNFQPAWAKTEEQARAAGALVIAVDRPGYGASTMHPGRAYNDFAHDVLQLANHLGIEKFAVAGYSSGGPHALAVAALFPERCTVCGLISSDAPYGDPRVGVSIEKMYGVGQVSLEWALERAEANAKSMRESYARIGREDKRAMAELDLATAVAQGFHGAASDSVLEARDWGFNLGTAGKVLLWHGEDDADVPIAAGRFLSEATDGHLEAIPGENHTLIRRHFQRILEAVCDAGAVASAAPAKTIGTTKL